ncbi:MAG: tetratricopeptide repeat protein [Archangiaceae bacterium]|nr:tetratricopeptide repeat protein [Archangiaceae bacterium]
MTPRLVAIGLCSVWILACPEERRVEEERRVRTTAQILAEGRAELAKNRPDRAVPYFKEAINTSPGDVDPYIQLAEAYRLAGNEPGAILTLKQAEEVAGGNDPSLKRARADMHLKLHQYKAAITEFVALRDMGILTDDELRMVALLLAHDGRVADAYATIDPILRRAPDDPPTKTVEAEILLIEGKELEAAKLIDALITATPDLTPARILRARYFITNVQLDAADQDLLAVKAADQKSLEVVTIRSRVLNALKRHEEAGKLVEPLLEEDPRNPVLLSLLAETRLLQERGVDAQVLIDKALGENAKFAPALYVRGRSLELGGNVDAAVSDYETAIRSDPTFAPPLSRLWGLYLKRKETGEAMSTLERLLFMGEATAREKIELVKLYTDTGANLQRAKTLITEALRREPKNGEYLKLKARIERALAPKQPGIIIMKHR